MLVRRARRQHDHRNGARFRLRAQRSHEFDAVHPRHLQVDEHDRRNAPAHAFERIDAVCGAVGLETEVADELFHRAPDADRIVDDQAHGCSAQRVAKRRGGTRVLASVEQARKIEHGGDGTVAEHRRAFESADRRQERRERTQHDVARLPGLRNQQPDACAIGHAHLEHDRRRGLDSRRRSERVLGKSERIDQPNDRPRAIAAAQARHAAWFVDQPVGGMDLVDIAHRKREDVRRRANDDHRQRGHAHGQPQPHARTERRLCGDLDRTPLLANQLSDDVEADAAARQLRRAIARREPRVQHETPERLVVEIFVGIGESHRERALADRVAIEAAAVVAAFDEQVAAVAAQIENDSPCTRLAATLAFDERLDAVVDRIAQQVPDRLDERLQQLRIDFGLCAGHLQRHFACRHPRSLAHRALPSRNDGLDPHGARLQRRLAQVDLQSLELRQRIAQRRHVPRELLLDQASVGARFGDATRHHLQIVVLVELERIEVVAFAPIAERETAHVDEAFEFGGEILQLVGTGTERRANAVDFDRAFLRLRQQDRRLVGESEQPLDQRRGHAQPVLRLGGARWRRRRGVRSIRRNRSADVGSSSGGLRADVGWSRSGVSVGAAA